MRIGIVTQPLVSNYGGILQNYALQTVLRNLGHDPITLDFFWSQPIIKYVLSTIKSLILYPFPRKRRSFSKLYITRTNIDIDSFVRKYITLTSQLHKYTSSIINRYNIDALITGSDQVWRPEYNPDLRDMYLNFARNENIKKIAYSASFGVSQKEYTKKNIDDCRKAALSLSAVSVREESGIKLCQEYFGFTPIWTLDPTLLLRTNDYLNLTQKIPINHEKYIGAYILDESNNTNDIINKVSDHISVSKVSRISENMDNMSPIQWLTIFRDAEFIITDSFHGTVFSIIFQKPFITINNPSRGGDRFTSLLNPIGLGNRLIYNNKEDIKNLLINEINWERIIQKIEEQRLKSLNFLIEALNKRTNDNP